MNKNDNKKKRRGLKRHSALLIHIGLFKEKMNKLIMKIGIWLIAHRQIKPGLFINDTFIMSKGLKAFFAMVGAHAAFTKTAKAHFAGCKVNNGIVDAATAKATGSSYLFGDLFI